METNFFKYLFAHLREHKVVVHYSLPPNTTFPACECVLVESQIYQERCVITFKIKVFADSTAQTTLQQYGAQITQALEGMAHGIESHTASIRLVEQSFEPPQKGALRILHQTYQAFIT